MNPRTGKQVGTSCYQVPAEKRACAKLSYRRRQHSHKQRHLSVGKQSRGFHATLGTHPDPLTYLSIRSTTPALPSSPSAALSNSCRPPPTAPLAASRPLSSHSRIAASCHPTAQGNIAEGRLRDTSLLLSRSYSSITAGLRLTRLLLRELLAFPVICHSHSVNSRLHGHLLKVRVGKEAKTYPMQLKTLFAEYTR